jgi:radical SAM superfamily enzyme YgiQ (UPF0313 family)
MNCKILLLSANRYRFPDPVFPIGLTCVHSALVHAGHETRLMDLNVDSMEAIERCLEDDAPDYVGISLRNIDDVMIRKLEQPYGDAVRLCGLVRRKTSRPIILGGAGYSIYPARMLELTGADYGVCGEGEHAMVQLIEALECGLSPGTVPGVVWRREGNVVLNPVAHRAAVPDETLSLRPERLTQFYLREGGMLNIQTQRGCALRCCFCTYPLIEGRRPRLRSPDAVAAEMEALKRIGAGYVFVVDSVFNTSEAHVTEICEAILRRGVRMNWGCFLRPAGLTPALMRLMARAGLTHVEFGSESFSDAVLRQYGKGLTFSDILRSSELAREVGIDYCHFLICGGPGETLETLEESFEHSRALPGAVIMAVVGMRIYPGTPLSRRAVDEGRVSRNSDLLTPEYYLAPGLTSETVFQKLNSFSARSPNWLPGDTNPAYDNLVSKLRKRGVMGPLWSYFAMTQRVWPQLKN